MNLALIDIVIGVILLIFLISGFRSGFVKKVLGLIALIIALIVATKFAADLQELVFTEMGLSGKAGFFASFFLIVGGITLTQSILYKVFMKDMIDSLWNNIFGMLMGAVEGALVVSMALIVLSIYFNLPSEETKAESQAYRPLKNFAPLVFDHVNTFLPESEDFYEQVVNAVTEKVNKVEKK